jgi:hypothetical protein
LGLAQIVFFCFFFIQFSVPEGYEKIGEGLRAHLPKGSENSKFSLGKHH